MNRPCLIAVDRRASTLTCADRSRASVDRGQQYFSHVHASSLAVFVSCSILRTPSLSGHTAVYFGVHRATHFTDATWVSTLNLTFGQRARQTSLPRLPRRRMAVPSCPFLRGICCRSLLAEDAPPCHVKVVEGCIFAPTNVRYSWVFRCRQELHMLAEQALTVAEAAAAGRQTPLGRWARADVTLLVRSRSHRRQYSDLAETLMIYDALSSRDVQREPRWLHILPGTGSNLITTPTHPLPYVPSCAGTCMVGPGRQVARRAATSCQ